MDVTLRMTDAVYTALRRHHLDPTVRRERISYAFGRALRGPRGLETILVADAPILPADDCYTSHSGGHVALDVGVMNAILAQFARSDCDILVNIHDHPFSPGGTTFSAIDDRDDLSLARYLRDRFEPMLARQPDIGRPRQVVSVALVLDQSGLAARYVDRRGSFRAINRVRIIGPSAVEIVPNDQGERNFEADETVSRQRDFITPAQQALIAKNTFAVVGLGGVGSIAAEALLRLGARRLVLIDPDKVEAHNLNRWQGGRPCDVGHHKAEVLARRLRAMGGRRAVRVHAIPHSVFSAEALPYLRRADALVGCLDNHLARYFLNRVALQYLTPYFDAGVNIVAGDRVDFESRYFAVIPGHTACAECTAYALFDHDQIDADLMDEITAEARRSAGYVGNRPEITATASAYPLNMGAVSTLMTELLNYFCGFRPLASCVADAWQGGRRQRSDRANHPEQPDPDCPACAHLLGAGDTIDLPRPKPLGHTARMLTEARARLLGASSQPPRP